MTIDKAIELLNELAAGFDKEALPDHLDALYLGIEALKVILKAREGNYASFKLLLPCESE